VLRHAIITLGQGVSMHHPDFVAYRKRLLAAGKPHLVALIATGRRAHRLAFAMLRSQQPFDERRWDESTAKGRPVTANEVTSTT